MSYRRYLGDERLKPYVDFSRKGMHRCIYCGNIADTREHVPSKVFLNKPLPSDFPVLPSCKQCNNGFSVDELYTYAYVDYLRRVIDDGDLEVPSPDEGERKEVIDAKQELRNAFERGNLASDERISRILVKLARGHAVYELSEGFYSPYMRYSLEKVLYKFKPCMSDSEWEDLEYAELLNDKLLPEVAQEHMTIF